MIDKFILFMTNKDWTAVDLVLVYFAVAAFVDGNYITWGLLVAVAFVVGIASSKLRRHINLNKEFN